MAYSGQTSHYGLPKYVSTDKPSWLDTNDAFDTIDAAIYAAATAVDPSTITTMQNDITALQSGKQDVLTFDAAPASGSVNPVTSGGVYTAVNNVSIALGVTDLKVSTLEGSMGNSDISAIGDGTVTGAISDLAGESVTITAIASDTYTTLLTKIKNALNNNYSKNSKIVSPEGSVFEIFNVSDGDFNLVRGGVSNFFIDNIRCTSDEWNLLSISNTIAISSRLGNTIAVGYVGLWTIYK